MSIEEFEKCCKGLTNSSQGIKIFKTNLKILAELKAKQEQLRKDAFKLQNDMNAFNECMKTRVLNCFQQNSEQHVNNVNAINEWYKKNYKNDETILTKQLESEEESDKSNEQDFSVCEASQCEEQQNNGEVAETESDVKIEEKIN